MMREGYVTVSGRHALLSAASVWINAVTSISIAALMLLCTLPLQPSTTGFVEETPFFESSGRDDIHDGDWAMARQQLVEPRYCESTFDYDIHSDYIATLDCPNYGESSITMSPVHSLFTASVNASIAGSWSDVHITRLHPSNSMPFRLRCIA